PRVFFCWQKKIRTPREEKRKLFGKSHAAFLERFKSSYPHQKGRAIVLIDLPFFSHLCPLVICSPQTPHFMTKNASKKVFRSTFEKPLDKHFSVCYTELVTRYFEVEFFPKKQCDFLGFCRVDPPSWTGKQKKEKHFEKTLDFYLR
ncbi:MAG: hypothetical protein IKJ35_07295, partial [Clostridia bacterium]|nr:hypothetical protein [Clostridia bacterium]